MAEWTPSRTRSTCYGYTVHGAHNWDKGDSRLWCPGTDGSNPQIPDALREKLRRIADQQKEGL